MILSTTYLQRDSHTKDYDMYQWNYCCFWRSGSFIVTTIRVLWLQIKKVNSRTDSSLLSKRQTFSYALTTALLSLSLNNKVKIISVIAKWIAFETKKATFMETSSYFKEYENIFRFINLRFILDYLEYEEKLNKLQPLDWNI